MLNLLWFVVQAPGPPGCSAGCVVSIAVMREGRKQTVEYMTVPLRTVPERGRWERGGALQRQGREQKLIILGLWTSPLDPPKDHGADRGA